MNTMTDKQKAAVLDTLDELTRRIGGCFGTADKVFAGHPNDEERAKELRQLAFDNGVSLQRVMQIVDSYLLNTGFVKEHLQEEQGSARAFFSKKLS